MNRKLLLVCVLLVSVFATFVVTYGGGWGGIRTSGGSLHISGYGYGLGQVDQAKVTATLNGSIICINNGTNTAPGQGSYSVTVTRTQDTVVRNGRFDFTFDFTDADLGVSQSNWQALGCPNANWVPDYIHHTVTFTLNEVENGVVINNTAASFSCAMNPPATSGEYVCS